VVERGAERFCPDVIRGGHEVGGASAADCARILLQQHAARKRETLTGGSHT
jgi:hypothetical protein